MKKEIEDTLDEVGLGGWIEPWDIKNIYLEVAMLEPGQTYLEVGVAHGASLSVACLAAQKGVNLYGIDIIDQPDRDEKMTAFLEKMGKEGDYKFIHGESQVWARYWNHGMIDVLFVDGDHTKKGVIRDIASWIPWVKDTVMFDDYKDGSGVKRAISEILFEHQAFKHKIDNEMYIMKRIRNEE